MTRLKIAWYFIRWSLPFQLGANWGIMGSSHTGIPPGYPHRLRQVQGGCSVCGRTWWGFRANRWHICDRWHCYKEVRLREGNTQG